MMKSAVKRALAMLPRTPTFDLVHNFVYFVYAHRRIPRRNSGLLNDHLFFFRHSPELRDALCQITSDKAYSKYFIDQIVGRPVTPRTIGVFDSVEAVRQAGLTGPCVLKSAHASGDVLFLEDEGARLSESDYDKLQAFLERDVYRESREVNYRNLRKRIICEELIDTASDIKDYKLFCYRGRVKFVQVDWARHGHHRQNFYDRNWNRVEVVYNRNPNGAWEERPSTYPEMVEISEKIARHFTLVRVDFYWRGDRLYVGEITHVHNQGHGVFASIEQERLVSDIIFG